MSSLTISMIVCVDCQPCSSTVVERPDANLAGFALAGEVPMGKRGAEQVGRLPLLQVVGIDLRVVGAHERLERAALLGRDLEAHQRDQVVHAFGAPVVLHRVGLHGVLLAGRLRRWRRRTRLIGLALLCRDC
jgi:hypothetical protein